MTGPAATPIAAGSTTCEGCRFWDRHTDIAPGRFGDCRRQPPRIIDRLVILPADDEIDDGFERSTAWPATFDGDWCGEWRSRAEAEHPGGRTGAALDRVFSTGEG